MNKILATSCDVYIWLICKYTVSDFKKNELEGIKYEDEFNLAIIWVPLTIKQEKMFKSE